MIILDTDHLTELRFPESQKHETLRNRMERASGERFATTIVNVEEQMRGWLAFIKRSKDLDAEIAAYARLAKMFEFFAEWEVIPLDKKAVLHCRQLRKEKVRLATQDLKIASIVLVNDGLLLSANLRDLKKVPGLKVENWLD